MKIPGLHDFLRDNPRMSVRPLQDDAIQIDGFFYFRASYETLVIEDVYELELTVPISFPREIPTVKEIGGRIPSKGSYHVNPDGTLCLGSHLRLIKALHDKPDLSSFAKTCIVPYVFNVSEKLRNGGNFITGELAHGTIGIVDDYAELFGLTSVAEVVSALEMLGRKKRIANKLPCPCNCGLRLGRCQLHHRLNQYRPTAARSWFSQHAIDILTRKFG